MEHKIKKGLLILFLSMLFLPVLQQCFCLFAIAPLYRVHPRSSDVTFSFSKWLDGSYQRDKEHYLNDHTGFRPYIVRVSNQLDYSLFSKLHLETVEEGANHCFYETSCINSYLGKDFVGKVAVIEKVRKLKAIQDTLSRLGKTLVLVHAASKSYYYPEYFPSKYRNVLRGATNLETYLHVADSMGVNQIDFNAWFVSMKNKCKENLYPREGTCWSAYSGLLTADSLVKYIEQMRHVHMLHPAWNNITHTKTARYDDNDITKELNLLFPITNETYSYPEVTYTGEGNIVRPNVIYIGDSFFIPWIRDRVMDFTNTDWQLWYNFDEVWYRYNEQNQDKEHVMNTDWIAKMNNADCIVITYTPANLPVLGNGFIEQAYSHFYKANAR